MTGPITGLMTGPITGPMTGRVLVVDDIRANVKLLAQLSLLEEVNSVLLSDCLKDASQIKGRGC